MICDPCREAGKLNADANRVYDPVTIEYLRHRAQEKHGECADPHTCPCNHQLGDFTNRRGDG